MPFRVFNLLLSIALSSSGLAASSSFKFLQHALGVDNIFPIFLAFIFILSGILYCSSFCRESRALLTAPETEPLLSTEPVVEPLITLAKLAQPMIAPRKVYVTKTATRYEWQFHIEPKTNLHGAHVQGKPMPMLSDAQLDTLRQEEKVTVLGETVVITKPVEFDPETFTKERTRRKILQMIMPPNKTLRAPRDVNCVLLEGFHVDFMNVGYQIHALMTPMVTVFNYDLTVPSKLAPNSKPVFTPQVAGYFKLSDYELSRIEELISASPELFDLRDNGTIVRCYMKPVGQTAVLRSTTNRISQQQLSASSKRATSLDDSFGAPVFLSDIILDSATCVASRIHSRAYNTDDDGSPDKEALSIFHEQFIKLDLDDPRLARFDLRLENLPNLSQQDLSEISKVLCEMMNERNKRVYDLLIARGGLTLGSCQLFRANYSPDCVYSRDADRSLLPTQIQLQRTRFAGPGLDSSGNRDTTPYIWLNLNNPATSIRRVPSYPVPNIPITRLLRTMPLLCEKYSQYFK